jgi:hydroxyacid-oxoacid transhydrogenase
VSCAHAWAALAPGEGEDLFTIETSAISFGRGAIRELGQVLRAHAPTARRVALFTDAAVSALAIAEDAKRTLAAAAFDVAVYDRVRVEPTDASFGDAARFATEGRFDAYVSLGGGSVIDTCKAAILYATYPADFLAYVNAPVGLGAPVPGPLPPHVACPTTAGTGSELTGIAVCDVLALHAKTGIASRRLRPAAAVVDPDATTTLPAGVVAASGFDVLCHALESFTARPFTARPRALSAAARPMSQGQNAWSDLGSREALRLAGRYLVRAVVDGADREAREQMMWAATLAGVAFGNAGVHVPHAMAYAIAGLAHGFRMPGYADAEPMVPHGVSVVVGAPAAFRFTAEACPDRHLEAAALLGADVRGAAASNAGDVVAEVLSGLMRSASVPANLAVLGYAPDQLASLVDGTAVQKRLLDNAPRQVSRADLEGVFARALGGAPR